MTGSWLIYGLLIGGLLALTAVILEAVCRIGGRQARYVWAGALGLTVVLVGLAPYRTVSPVQPRPHPAEPVGPATEAVDPMAILGDIQAQRQAHGLAGSLRGVYRAIMSPVQSVIAAVGERLPERFTNAFLIAWGGISTALLVLFATVFFHYHRARRRWPAAQLHGTRVRIAPDGGPAVIGVLHPTIIVPHWLFCSTPEEQRLVIAHEQEHVRARDPLLLAVACVVAALLPWHPAVWWMLTRLRLAVELDCDGRVLGQGVAPRAYGSVLIDLAARCSGFPLSAPALTDKPSHLRQRLLAMKPLHRPFPRIRGALLGALAACALVLACATQVPAATAQVQADTAVSNPDEPVAAISVPEPRYPASLLDSALSGFVELQYIVDTAGRVEPNSFKILSRTHDDFVAAAKEALLKGTFKPARFRGRLVRQLVQQKVSFAVSNAPPPPPSARPERPAPRQLDELVTTATGRQRRVDIGNDVTVIRADSVVRSAPIRRADSVAGADSAAPVRSVTDLLEGRVPGLTVQRTSGAPGDPSRLRLRGAGSPLRSNDPIVIVDGVRVYAIPANLRRPDSTSRDSTDRNRLAPSPLDLINPNMIETIEVLKGPAAATLYGADAAANGVIVITTKR